MPTYQYACENCGYEFEKFQIISANPIRKCPECGKLKLRRLIGTGAGVIFKGSGFYETDYRSDSYKKAQEGEKKTTTDKPAAEAKPAESSASQAPEKKQPAKKSAS
jgi:putative FmdB family regulatory protein